MYTDNFHKLMKEQSKLETGKDSLMNAIRSVFYNPPRVTDKGIMEFLTSDNTTQNLDVKYIGSTYSCDTDSFFPLFKVMAKDLTVMKKLSKAYQVEIRSQKDFKRYSGLIKIEGTSTFTIQFNQVYQEDIENQEDFKLNVI